MKLRQQTADCADFDVFVHGDDAAFRVLLPKLITAEGLNGESPLLHTIPGTWSLRDDRMSGTFTTPHPLTVFVSMHLRGTDMAVALAVRNDTTHPLANVEGNVCLSPNHLPGQPGWYNPRFIPEMAPDRDAQGRCWYTELTPGRLQVLTVAGWGEMHAHPRQPDPDAVPPYCFAPSARTDAAACAVPSLDGTRFLFQAWSCPCRYIAPFPGNACMHLLPTMADTLAPGAAAVVYGLIGIFEGDREALTAYIAAFRNGLIHLQ
ncbi:MAG: hypothetical protein ACYC6A_17685 [Armatimonadota bacterium]